MPAGMGEGVKRLFLRTFLKDWHNGEYRLCNATQSGYMETATTIVSTAVGKPLRVAEVRSD